MAHRVIVPLALVALLSGCSDVYTDLFVTQPTAISLWPGGAPGSETKTAPERTYVRHEAATADTPDVSFNVVTDINDPSIEVFHPEEGKSTGAAVIILPGGGHQFLSIDHEGNDVAKLLASRGITGIVLKYRLAKADGSTYRVQVESLMDVQRAIRVVRGNAQAWSIDTKRVGLLGFSAGGELALLAATTYATPVPTPSKDLDAKLDCRPDFVGLLYPGGLSDPDSVEIPKDMPPAFLCCTLTDTKINPANVEKFYHRLQDKNIPAQLQIYPKGGHGFGVRPTGLPAASWPDRFIDWMRDRGMLNGQLAVTYNNN